MVATSRSRARSSALAAAVLGYVAASFLEEASWQCWSMLPGVARQSATSLGSGALANGQQQWLASPFRQGGVEMHYFGGTSPDKPSWDPENRNAADKGTKGSIISKVLLALLLIGCFSVPVFFGDFAVSPAGLLSFVVVIFFTMAANAALLASNKNLVMVIDEMLGEK
eukprot:TRINITY_DN14608_c0_g1_i2.p1 TRINITY_DN14608_c0_g1~~TRINITY_DN14608_c0_g1_i2.p1  ORF type:complete len:192 (+),score=39.29 TRINITY_DN14608_c0_g1_i2:74-577(+)